jgi:hypothetical protein
MSSQKYKEYTVTLTILVDEDADFFEADNGHNLDVLEELFEEAVYDFSDMKLKAIEVEYTGD